MKKALIMAAAGIAAAWLAAGAATSNAVTLDTRTLAAGQSACLPQVDARGLTRAVSGGISLDTRKIVGTLLLIK